MKRTNTAGQTITEDSKETKPPADRQRPEELPEGVTRGKNSNGKPELLVEDSRWKNIYNNHQMVQQVSEILEEPATVGSLELRNDAYMTQERLFNGRSLPPQLRKSTIAQ